MCQITYIVKAQHDKIKRKALLTPHISDASQGHPIGRQNHEEPLSKGRASMSFGSNAVDLGAVVGGMEANGVGFICTPSGGCY